MSKEHDELVNKALSAVAQMEREQESSPTKVLEEYQKMNKQLREDQNRESNEFENVALFCLCIGPFAFHALGASYWLSIPLTLALTFIAVKMLK